MQGDVAPMCAPSVNFGSEVILLAPLGGSGVVQQELKTLPAKFGNCAALLKKTPRPTDAQIREAMFPNLCRCGTHMRILRAVRRASES